MIESALSIAIAGVSLGFTILTHINNKSSRVNERLTRLETQSGTLDSLPERVTKIEAVAEYSHTRIDNLEVDLKADIKEVKEIVIELLRSTKH